MIKLSFQQWLEFNEQEETIRLFHGTDAQSADNIAKHGLSALGAGEFNAAGEFWASPKSNYAYWFAKTNPRGIEEIALVSFEIPKKVLRYIFKNNLGHKHSPVEFEFTPASFKLINSHMTNAKVEPAEAMA